MQSPVIRTAARALKAAVDIVMPLVCVHCGEEGALLCKKCISTSPRPSIHLCMKCAEPVGEHYKLCVNCATLPPPLDRLVPVYRYGGAVRSAVHALKYRYITAIAPVMAEPMWQHRFAERGQFDCVIPVPQHRDRLRERGYNQAALLAQNISRHLRLQLIEDGLTKTRSTPSQVELTRQQRATSLKGAIKANYDFDGAHVLLTDDVHTTGSTLMHCAAALKLSKAKRVSAIVYAKEMNDTDTDSDDTSPSRNRDEKR